MSISWYWYVGKKVIIWHHFSPETLPEKTNSIKGNLTVKVLSLTSLALHPLPLTSSHSCRTDSEIFEDAVELQHFLIRIRDELCKNGEILMSPALSYSGKHLHGDVDKEKKEKLPREFEEDRLKREEEKRGACFKKYISNQHFISCWVSTQK